MLDHLWSQFNTWNLQFIYSTSKRWVSHFHQYDPFICFSTFSILHGNWASFVKYVCDQCHNKTTCLSYLHLHKRSIHVIELWVHSNLTGLARTASYVCYHCDNRATDKSDQQRHLISKHDKGLAKTSMIAFYVIIMEIIRIIFYSILDLDMRVWHMFVMNVTSQNHNRIIFLIILECRIEERSILAINVNMH